MKYRLLIFLFPFFIFYRVPRLLVLATMVSRNSNLSSFNRLCSKHSSNSNNSNKHPRNSHNNNAAIHQAQSQRRFKKRKNRPSSPQLHLAAFRIILEVQMQQITRDPAPNLKSGVTYR